MTVEQVNKILKDNKMQNKDTNFKIKTKIPPGVPDNPRKPPKYFTDFKNEMLDFIKEQRAFNAQVLDFIKEQIQFNKEQRQFNQFVLDQFKKHKWIK